MITLTLWQLRWRLLVVALLMLFFYRLEPGLHLNGAVDDDLLPNVADPNGIAFTLANLAGASMLVLLSGFVSADRREGYYRIYFSHPTRPLAFYAVRWLVAYVLSVGAAAVFLMGAQLVAWGELRAGAGAMVQPAVFALIYGGLAAFFSVVLARGDGLAALGVYALKAVWEYAQSVFSYMQTQPMSPFARQAITFVLPPHAAVEDIYTVAHAGGGMAWGSLAFASGYGLFWLALAGLLLWSREWP